MFDILQRAYNILMTGDEVGSNGEEMLNIKPRERAQNTINYFRQNFDVDYYSSGGFDLSFILRQEVPSNHNFTKEHSNHAYAFASVLQTVWKPVKLLLLENYQQKRTIHKSWNK